MYDFENSNYATCVTYFIIGRKNKILERHNSACYHRMTYGCLPKQTTKIVCYHKVEQTPYPEQDCARWIKDVANFGFKMEYNGLGHNKFGISDKHHVITIPIKIGRKVFYKNKTFFTSALMLVRYLFEYNLFRLPSVYFDLLEQLPKNADRFRVMQMAHIGIRGNTNHSLREGSTQTLISKKEFIKRANKQKFVLTNTSHPSISALWRGRYVKLNEDLSTRKKYNMLKDDKTTIYVVGGDTNYANWLPNVRVVDSLEKAQVVLFTGGEDVDPSLYNEVKNPLTSSNITRDLEEKAIFQQAKQLGLKFLGICRGSQFMCVMAGGKLVQDQGHPGREHLVQTPDGPINITSTHHQAAYPFNMPSWNYEVLGWTENLCGHHSNGEGKEMNPRQECEVVYYRNIKALGIQGHPEFAGYQNNPANRKSLEYLKDLFTKLVNNNL